MSKQVREGRPQVETAPADARRGERAAVAAVLGDQGAVPGVVGRPRRRAWTRVAPLFSAVIGRHP
jgi:hypothetical protein